MANIETITVGENTYNVLAMSQVSYSTTEQNTGLTWIDGKPVYQATINFGAIPSGTKTVNHGISNIDNVVDVKGVAINLSTHETKPIPYVNTSSLGYQIQVENVTRTLIDIRTGLNWSAYNAFVTIQYTKTTD